MAMIEQSDMDRDNDDAPLFNGFNRGRLLRMSIAAMEVIDNQIERHFERMTKQGEKAHAQAGRASA